MGPTFVLLPWMHGALILALALVALLGLVADAIANYRELRRRHARERGHRLAKLHADAGEIEA